MADSIIPTPAYDDIPQVMPQRYVRTSYPSDEFEIDNYNKNDNYKNNNYKNNEKTIAIDPSMPKPKKTKKSKEKKYHFNFK